MGEKTQVMIDKPTPDFSKVVKYSDYVKYENRDDRGELNEMHARAKKFLEDFDWCAEIKGSYVGLFYPGIVGVFLFNIRPARDGVDEWVWVVDGDLPPAYLTCDQCSNPATALDAYIGEMQEWVRAVEEGESVEDLIPVDVPTTVEWASTLKDRLEFLDQQILCHYEEDLKG